MKKYQTSFEKGDVILYDYEYVTIMGVRYEDEWQYKIRDSWEDAALIDANAQKVELKHKSELDL